MKKILVAVLCMMLVATVAVTAFAADGAAFTATASKTDLYREDTVTITVDVSCDEEATSYGLSLNYDANLLELTDGSCTVNGTLVSSFSEGFAFMFQNATAYSGTVGTATFKVKDDAAFGDTVITGEASVKNGTDVVTATGCSVTLTVKCNHNYGAWTKADNGHSKTCSICGDVITEDHNWNNGTVTKNAKCNEKGTKTYTCKDCGATKDEPIDMIPHTFGEWERVDDTTHKRTCTSCGKEETENHDFGTELVAGENTHWYECACGDKKEETEHVFDNTIWSKNNKTHWHACECGAKTDEEDHIWDDGKVTKEASSTEEGVKTYTCKVCEATKTEKIAKIATSSPKTGNNFVLIIALLLISSSAFVSFAVYRKRVK